MHTDSKKQSSFLALLFTAGDLGASKEKKLTIMDVTFSEGLKNLVVGISEILLEKGKFLGVAILMISFMTFFAITWAGIALLLGVELNEVSGPIPYKGFRSMDYGSPVIWTISCILAAGINILVFFGIKSIFRKIRYDKSKASTPKSNSMNRNSSNTTLNSNQKAHRKNR
jgi:hypothetical protein